MKKLLSVFLAMLLLGMSLAVGAAAAPEVEIEDFSLQFELPVVTGIEAVWNGEILVDEWLRAYFTPENVAVTVSFAEVSSAATVNNPSAEISVPGLPLPVKLQVTVCGGSHMPMTFALNCRDAPCFMLG